MIGVIRPYFLKGQLKSEWIMLKSPYRIGMRTIKTGIAVALCMIFFHYTNRGTPALAALAAVFSLRADWRTSFNFGRNRIFGNAVGAILATALVLFQTATGNQFVLEIIGVSIGQMLVIIICDRLNYHDGIIGGTATYMITYFTIPMNATYIYGLNRVLDTVIGSIIAILVNIALSTYVLGKIKSSRFFPKDSIEID
jgi:uncharacterized membrane protein YgaE (UPF0421/DUF939 family)